MRCQLMIGGQKTPLFCHDRMAATIYIYIYKEYINANSGRITSAGAFMLTHVNGVKATKESGQIHGATRKKKNIDRSCSNFSAVGSAVRRLQ
jgi:hypothetical protein